VTVNLCIDTLATQLDLSVVDWCVMFLSPRRYYSNRNPADTTMKVAGGPEGRLVVCASLRSSMKDEKGDGDWWWVDDG
jgi:hypothetical protein